MMSEHLMWKTTAQRAARYALYGVLGGWLAVTAAAQEPTRRYDAKIRRLDPLGLMIPDWRFFAPRPGMHDQHLLVRDELPNGDFTPWKETCQVEPRKWHHFFWYPGQRAEKVVVDAVSGLITMQPILADRKEDVQVSIPYLTLLNYVTHQVPHHPETKRVQFLIANSAGYDESEEPTMVFLSNPHPLD
jgi:hypothetical protein